MPNALDEVIPTLEDYIDFYRRFTLDTEPGWLSFAQSIRMRAGMVRKRILNADGTGIPGKTCPAVGEKFALEKDTKKRHPTMVFVPNSGIIEAWSSDEINKYAEKFHHDPQKVQAVIEYSDLAKVTPDLDFLVINWEKLQRKSDSQQWDMLKKAMSVLNPEYFIFDECHNAKNINSLRGQTVQRLIQHTIGKYVTLLSATPIPNRYKDLAMIFHMLDPIRYKEPRMFTYSPADEMKRLLNNQSWFRLTPDRFKEQLGLGTLHPSELVYTPTTRQEDDLYFQDWSECLTIGESMTGLRQVLLNPNLSRYYHGPTLPSSKIRAVKSLTDRLVAQGEKVAVKTNLVTGVLEELVVVLGKYNPLVISAPDSRDARKETAKRFREDPDSRVLILTGVSDESRSLSPGTRVSIISPEPEITPGGNIQLKGRFYRRGQVEDVRHYIILAQSQYLLDQMNDFVDSLSKASSIKVPKKFTARIIDEDMFRLCCTKENINDKILSCQDITRKEESIYDANNPSSLRTHFSGILAPSTFKKMGPFQKSIIMQANWRGMGEENFEQLAQTKMFKEWIKLYEKEWEGSASERTNKLIELIVDDHEPVYGKTPTIIDVGCGAAYFARASGRSTVCVDISKVFLELGKRICRKRGIVNQYLTAHCTDIPLNSEIADVVVNSYSIFYLAEKAETDEVERCVLETNRLLKTGGLFIMTLPYTVEQESVREFTENVEVYGFEPVVEMTPKKTKCSGMSHGCHVIAYEKMRDVKSVRDTSLGFYGAREKIVG